MLKLKMAYYLGGGCAGCETSLLDTATKLMDFLDHVELMFFAPTLIDKKYKDLESIPDGSIDIGFFTGNVRNSEHEHIAKFMRRKCKTLIAFGICASLGGIKGLVNIYRQEEIVKKAYIETITTDNTEGIVPQPEYVADGKYPLDLPVLKPARALDQVVKVDYYVGGCPPHYNHIKWILESILKNDLPAKGSWLTMGTAVCDACPRNPIRYGGIKKKPTQVKRTLEKPPKDVCLLEAGYLCLGPITQGDCGAACLKANMPCRGCGGPIPGVSDFAIKAVSTIATTLDNKNLLKEIPAPVQLFYRYSLPKSKLIKSKD
ncbi:NADH ubiquinone oxidoreductase 20 kDa subunit [Desulfurobacterium thermolithotrophum DSM 11699]|uniref:NADH ubiquinone oxidoreductase 20 kDa subunit n=1 Tax=Desulfurobacterium thermolithotrophum (strain DSM 11699 / BSA) TaxID=868864 RepID=F0S2F9_DESTD|nr:NADH ubiquinone dehydrogenase [Desulfurobacterium thermolithotrophum]ADY73031.1 NADH ubiquinone oxidoreductase 20 kDa subunit [Desulfurobacterium thermolithotrophum DSM 11699]